MCKEMAKCLNLVNLCVCVLPVVVLAAGPLERWGPPAHGRCSGSRRRRTAALRREASGSAGRCGLSPAGSYSTAHRGQRTNREEVECCCLTFQQNFREVFKCQDKPMRNFIFFVLIYYSSVSIVGQLAQSKNEEGHLVCPYHKEI